MYTVIYHKSVLDDLKKITKADSLKIRKAIEKKLIVNPLIFGEPLRSSLVGYRKLRVGEYRIVYQIQERNRILVIIIAHRRNVYDFVKNRVLL